MNRKSIQKTADNTKSKTNGLEKTNSSAPSSNVQDKKNIQQSAKVETNKSIAKSPTAPIDKNQNKASKTNNVTNNSSVTNNNSKTTANSTQVSVKKTNAPNENVFKRESSTSSINSKLSNNISENSILKTSSKSNLNSKTTKSPIKTNSLDTNKEELKKTNAMSNDLGSSLKSESKENISDLMKISELANSYNNITTKEIPSPTKIEMNDSLKQIDYEINILPEEDKNKEKELEIKKEFKDNNFDGKNDDKMPIKIESPQLKFSLIQSEPQNLENISEINNPPNQNTVKLYKFIKSIILKLPFHEKNKGYFDQIYANLQKLKSRINQSHKLLNPNKNILQTEEVVYPVNKQKISSIRKSSLEPKLFKNKIISSRYFEANFSPILKKKINIHEEFLGSIRVSDYILKNEKLNKLKDELLEGDIFTERTDLMMSPLRFSNNKVIDNISQFNFSEPDHDFENPQDSIINNVKSYRDHKHVIQKYSPPSKIQSKNPFSPKKCITNIRDSVSPAINVSKISRFYKDFYKKVIDQPFSKKLNSVVLDSHLTNNKLVVSDLKKNLAITKNNLAKMKVSPSKYNNKELRNSEEITIINRIEKIKNII